MGKQATSHARRFVAREGTTRRARDPPVRYLDKPPRPSLGAHYINPGVQFSMSERVQFRRSVDSLQPVGCCATHTAPAKNLGKPFSQT